MKRILFVCVENSCRSQMAEGFARYYGQGIVQAYSAGSRPAGTINPDAVIVMNEVGIDISSQLSKGFSDLPVRHIDTAVTLGCKDTCPYVPANAHVAWSIDDPKGKDRGFFRKVRDEIQEKVRQLIGEIAAAEAMQDTEEK